MTFAWLSANDLVRRSPRRHDLDTHLGAAVAWLERAHDHGTDRGVSYGYSLRAGWGPSYRETSGYIAETFFDLARDLGNPDHARRAIEVAQWLLSVQNADGSFSNPRYGTGGIVFDTGQDLFGLVRAARETGSTHLLDGARRAARWLVDIAGPDDRWTRNEHLGTAHVYNARTAWALLEADRLLPDADPARRRVARANLDWAVAEQQPSGLFDHCAFERGKPPFTHTLAYAVRGLLQSGLLLDEPRYLAAATRGADAVMQRLDPSGFLPGHFRIDGTGPGRYCCLTGNCQFAIVWSVLHRVTGDHGYRAAAERATDYVLAHHDVATRLSAARGGVKGSHPIWGRYAPMSFPNWPAKFLVDALLLRRGWSS